MKKGLYAIIAVLLAAILMVEIRTFYHGSRTESSDKINIGLVLTDCMDNWEQEVYESIEKYAKEELLELTTVRSGRSLADQMEAIRSLMVYESDVIIFSPVMEGGWDDIVMQAQELNIPLITVCEDIAERAKSGAEIYHVGFDYHAVGEALGVEFAAGTKGETGQYVTLLGGITSSITNRITEGFQRVLTEKQLQLSSFSVSGENDRLQAHMVVNGLIQNDYAFRAIVSYSEGMALGAIDALTENGLLPGKDVQIYTTGGSGEILQAFSEGRIRVLAKCDPDLIGAEAVNSALLLIEGKGTERDIYLHADTMAGV